MHRPWHQKVAAAFGRGSNPSIDDIARLRTAAQAIIYLREGASNDRGTLDKQIETQGKAMEGILVERMRDNPIEVSAVRQIIRTAVLALLGRRAGATSPCPGDRPSMATTRRASAARSRRSSRIGVSMSSASPPRSSRRSMGR